jgi:hypothetical protein
MMREGCSSKAGVPFLTAHDLNRKNNKICAVRKRQPYTYSNKILL